MNPLEEMIAPAGGFGTEAMVLPEAVLRSINWSKTAEFPTGFRMEGARGQVRSLRVFPFFKRETTSQTQHRGTVATETKTLEDEAVGDLGRGDLVTGGAGPAYFAFPPLASRSADDGTALGDIEAGKSGKDLLLNRTSQ